MDKFDLKDIIENSKIPLQFNMNFHQFITTQNESLEKTKAEESAKIYPFYKPYSKMINLNFNEE
jgi:hypothetical protein